MKLLNVSHNKKDYEFRLLESCRVIEVTKADVFTYILKWSVSLFRCNCPGSVYHGKCWHSSIIGQLKDQPTITEPWADIAEEAGRMQYERM